MNSDLRAKLIVDKFAPPGMIRREKAVEIWDSLVKQFDEVRNETLEEAAKIVENYPILDPIIAAAAIRARKIS